MAHFVTGFIIKTNFVPQIYSQYPSLRAVPLEQEVSLFPLTDELLDGLRIPKFKALDDIGIIPSELTALLARLSVSSRVLYFETEYFGGSGSQFAVVFDKEKIVFGPAKAS